VWCQGGDSDALGALGLSVRPDAEPHGGPLAAIETAVGHAAPDDVVIAACDLPDLDGATVAALVRAGHDVDAALIVAATDASGAHLVCWCSPPVAGRIADLRAAGTVSYRTALERLGAGLVEVDSARLRNVNRPGDLGAG
jgi:molybdopterin-guanine dinucleotide biosynthesis protein A